MLNGMWIDNLSFFLKNSFWLSCKLHKPYLTLRPFGVQLFNLFIHYSSFFLSDSRSSTWTIRVTLNFQLLGDLLNNSVCKGIFVLTHFSQLQLPGISQLISFIESKENFRAYLTQFIYLTRLAHRNMIMVAIDMHGKSPITRKWMYGIKWKHVLPFISFLYLLISLIV